MFTRRTLFILGAGPSLEVGLPLGTELAKIIREKMDVRFEYGFSPIGGGDHDLYAQLKNTNRENAREFWLAAQRIEAGLGFAQSIDDFLDQHRSDAAVNHYGKAAIVRAVREVESKSKLYFDRFSDTEKLDPDKFADTWFAKFMHVLGRGIHAKMSLKFSTT